MKLAGLDPNLDSLPFPAGSGRRAFLFSDLLQNETSGLPLRSTPKELPYGWRGERKAEPDSGSAVQLLARRLAEQTGISEPDARLLIELIGTNWNSLVFQARLMKS
ncbi:MAG: hypothetical protein EOR16_24625, partial [Mesorhizobium sp.]